MQLITCLDMPIKWRLAAVMADREMDYKDVAAATGMHPGTVSKLKNNLPARLDIETLLKLCEALNCQPGDLLRYMPESKADKLD